MDVACAVVIPQARACWLWVGGPAAKVPSLARAWRGESRASATPVR